MEVAGANRRWRFQVRIAVDTFVMDNWAWKPMATTTNNSYLLAR